MTLRRQIEAVIEGLPPGAEITVPSMRDLLRRECERWAPPKLVAAELRGLWVWRVLERRTAGGRGKGCASVYSVPARPVATVASPSRPPAESGWADGRGGRLLHYFEAGSTTSACGQRVRKGPMLPRTSSDWMRRCRKCAASATAMRHHEEAMRA